MPAAAHRRRALALLVPNTLTALRCVAGLLILLYGVAPVSWSTFGLLLAAELSDFFDGIVARLLGGTSRFGALADPVADKIFNLAVGWFAYRSQLLPAWFFSWLAFAYGATALLYVVNLIVRRPPRGQRVPKPHRIGRIAGFITAFTVLAAIVPCRFMNHLAVLLAYVSVASTVLHALLTAWRLRHDRQEFYSAMG